MEGKEAINRCKKQFVNYFSGVTLLPEHQDLYNLEVQKRLVFNLRFFNLAVLVAVILFSLAENYQIIDKTVSRQIFLTRIILVITYIIPFILISFSIKSIKRPNLLLALNAFGFIVYFAVQSYISRDYTVALFNNTIAIFLLNICLYLILGIQFSFAVILSSVILLVMNLIFHHMVYLNESAITAIDLNFWFVVTTAVVALVARNINNLLKKSFQTNMELKKANEVKYKLFSMVSHDLKNMISAQYSISDCLKDDHYKMNEGDRNRMIDILHRSSQDVLNLFEDLMDWIKTQIETIKPTIKNIDLELFNQSVINQMLPAAESKRIQLILNSDANKEISTDPKILGLIMRNILGNAIKYSHTDSTISIKNTTKNGFIEYYIADTGIGMTDERLNQLFDFHTMNSEAGTRGEKGTGLGLILTKELVTVLDGTIQIESTPKIGTIVSFKLPDIKNSGTLKKEQTKGYKLWLLN